MSSFSLTGLDVVLFVFATVLAFGFFAGFVLNGDLAFFMAVLFLFSFFLSFFFSSGGYCLLVAIVGCCRGHYIASVMSQKNP